MKHNFLTVGRGLRGNVHASLPAMYDHRVAPWQIAHTSGWEDSLIGTSVPLGCTPAAAINPASVVSSLVFR
jgi:hypothetical protein